MPFHTLSSPTALCTIIIANSYFPFTFQSPLFPSLSPSFQFSLLLYFLLLVFAPLTFLFLSTFVVLWLLLPHEKGGSVLPVLPRVRVLPGLLRVNHKGLRSAQLSLYGTPGIPPACFFLWCLMVRPLLLLIPRCSLVNLVLPVPPRF